VIIAVLLHELGRVIDHHTQDAARRLLVDVGLLDFAIGVGGVFAAGFFSTDGILIIQCSDGKLLHLERVDAVVLPMAVAAESEDMADLIVPQPLEEVVRLMLEASFCRWPF
jgi:hypothetical protein